MLFLVVFVAVNDWHAGRTSESPRNLRMIRSLLLIAALAACTAPTPDQAASSTPPLRTTPATTLPPATPPPRPPGYAVTSGDHIDLITEPGVGVDITTRVIARADASARAIETEFGRSFDNRPSVYLFTSDQSFKDALVGLFGYGNPAAERSAMSAAALALPPQTIILNWSRIAAGNSLSAVHHELVHLIVGQRLKPGAFIPAWLNEGTAYLSETTLPGMEWLASTIRYGAASMAANKALLHWNRIERHAFPPITGVGRDFAYVQSAQMVSFLREDVRPEGLLRIFELIEQGAGFEAAYQQVAGRGIGEFAAALPDRFFALAPAYPGIVLAGDAPTGDGPSLLVYGLEPRTPVSVELRSSVARAVSSGTTDDGGLYFVLLANVASGSYTATVSGSRSTTATIRIGR